MADPTIKQQLFADLTVLSDTARFVPAVQRDRIIELVLRMVENAGIDKDDIDELLTKLEAARTANNSKAVVDATFAEFRKELHFDNLPDDLHSFATRWFRAGMKAVLSLWLAGAINPEKFLAELEEGERGPVQ